MRRFHLRYARRRANLWFLAGVVPYLLLAVASGELHQHYRSAAALTLGAVSHTAALSPAFAPPQTPDSDCPACQWLISSVGCTFPVLAAPAPAPAEEAASLPSPEPPSAFFLCRHSRAPPSA